MHDAPYKLLVDILSQTNDIRIDLSPDQPGSDFYIEFFNMVPRLEKQSPTRSKLEAAKTEEQVIKAFKDTNFVIIFNPTVPEDLKSIYEKTQKVTINYVTVVFYEIIAILYTSHVEPSEKHYSQLVESLINCIQLSSMYQYVSFLFVRLFQKMVSSNKLMMNPEVCDSIVIYLSLDKNLSPSIYPVFNRFANIIFTLNEKNLVSKLLFLFDSFVANKFSIVQDSYESIAELMLNFFFNGNCSFNHQAMLLTAKLSHLTNGSTMQDIFHQMPKLFLDHITSFGLLSFPEVPVEEFSEIEPYWETPSTIEFEFDFVHIIKNETYDIMEKIPHKLMDESETPFNAINPEIQQITKITRDTLSTACAADVIIFLDFYLKYLNAYVEKTDCGFKVTNPNYYDLLVIFLFILEELKNDKFFEESFINLCYLCGFNPKQIAFDPKSISPLVNSLRNELLYVMLFQRNSKQLMLQLFENYSKTPILLAELITRMLALNQKNLKTKPLPLEYFQDENLLLYTINCAIMLQQINMKVSSQVLTEARNSMFVFLFELAHEHYYFAIKNYVIGLFRYIYEPEISNMTLKIIAANCNNSNMSPVMSMLQKILLICSKKTDDPRHRFLVIKLAEIIETLAITNPKDVSNIRPLLSLLFTNLNLIQTNELVIHILNIVSVISQVNSSFTLSSNEFRAIAFVIRSNPFDEEILITLLSLISGTGKLPLGKIMLILRPCFVPLVIASFCESPKIMEILTNILMLCEQSHYNKIAFHKGELDYLLMKCLSKSNFTYQGIQISIPDSCHDICLKLLHIIDCEISSYSIVQSFIESYQKKNYEMCREFCKIMTKNLADPSPSFSIGCFDCKRYENSFSLNKSGVFTFNLWIKIDLLPILRSNASLVLFEIYERNVGVFSIFINQATIFVRYDRNGMRTMVQIFPKPPYNEWFMLTVMHRNIDQKNGEIKTYMNENKILKSEMCQVQFSDQPINLSFGGIDTPVKTQWSGTPLIQISDFKIYSRHVNCFERDNLLAKNTDAPTDYVFKLNINDNDKYKFPDCFVDSSAQLINTIDFKETIPHLEVFGIIQQLFVSSIEFQNEFRSTMKLARKIFESSWKIDSRLYFSFLSIMKTITNENLLYSWFDNIIMNMRIWLKADPISFERILNNWNILTCSYESFFTKANYFQILISFYELLFCFENEQEVKAGKQQVLTPVNKTFSLGLLFNNSFTTRNIFHCRKVYVQLLKAVGSLTFTKDDCDFLMCYTLGAYQSLNMVHYLEIVRYLAPKISLLPFNELKYDPLKCLHLILTMYPYSNIQKLIIYAIHDIAGDQVHHEMLILSYQPELGSKLEELKQGLYNNYQNYPNLYQLICNFSLFTGKDEEEKTAKMFEFLLESGKVAPTTLYASWYVWPLILSFQSTPRVRSLIYDFLIKYASYDSKKETKYQAIISMIILMITVINHKDADFLFEFVKKLVEYCDREQSDSKDMNNLYFVIYKILVGSAFFHFITTSHNAALVKLYHQSSFCTSTFVPTATKYNKINLFNCCELQTFVEKSYSYLKLNFELQMDPDQNLIHQKNLDLAIHIYQKQKLEQLFPEAQQYSDIVDYIMNKNKFVDNQANTKLNNFTMTLARLRESFYADFISSITSQCNSLKTEIRDAKKLLDEMKKVDVSSMKEFRNKSCEHIFSTRIPPKIKKQKSKNIMIRDINLSHYMPCKLKPSMLPKPKIETCYEYDIFSGDCTLIRPQMSRKSVLKIYKSRVHVVQNGIVVKEIKNNDIWYIISKKGSVKQTAIEIITKYGDSIYADFAPNTNKAAIKSFNSANLPMLKLLVKGKPKKIAKLLKTEKWKTSQISNFKYLMQLNILSGRSFNDSSNYPLFPNILGPNSDSFIFYDKPVDPSTRHLFWIADKSSLHDELSKSCYLPPEYYYFPEIIQNSDKLPEWASNKYEFVYMARKKLESLKISVELSKWIESIWGMKNQAQVPNHIKLFGEGSVHPDRNPIIPFDNMQNRQFMLDLSSKICFTGSCFHQNEIIICMVDESSYIRVVKYNYEDFSAKQIPPGWEIPNNPHDCVFCQVRKTIFIFDKAQSTFSRFEFWPKQQLFDPIPFDGYLDIFCMLKTELVYYTFQSYFCGMISDGSTRVICKSKEKATCMTASHQYSTLVYSTIDGFAHICSLDQGFEIRAYDLNGEQPNEICITKKWGFILIRTPTKIIVLNINGSLILQREFDSPVVKMFPFSTYQDFEFLATYHADNHLGVFEIMKPDSFIYYDTEYDVIHVSYDSIHQCFLVTTSDGMIKIVIHSLN